MGRYLIEFRFIHYPTKKRLKGMIWHIDKKFHLRRARRARPVPHISLAGPLTTNNEQRLINDFYDVCSRHPLMKFKVKGFGVFEENRVVYLGIQPSTQLADFRWLLARKIKDFCKLAEHDYKEEFTFHITLAMKLSPHKFDMVKKYVEKMQLLNFDHIMVRATIVKGGRILVEYDFLQRKMLNRRQAKSREGLAKTGQLLDDYFKGRHDPNKKIEQKPVESPEKLDSGPVGEYTKTIKLKQGFFDRLFHRKIFVISDNHFDHANIIRFCKRPFKSTEEMNRYMLEKWNKIIRKRDKVIFLGDLAYGRGSRSTKYWLNQVNGDFIFIKGNHDVHVPGLEQYKSLIIEYKGEKFYLTHSPADVPASWTGWAICGHHHNNQPVEFPLINKKTKRMNVSVELLDYTPIELDELLNKRSD